MRTIQRTVVGPFIFSNDGKLLLGKGGVYKDQWIVPGGGVEPGETKLEALRRETLEETGIDINDGVVKKVKGNLTGESEKILRDTGEKVLVKMDFNNYTVHLPLPADKIKLKAEDDFKEATWVHISELKSLNLAPPSIASLKLLGYL